jgi:NADH-quinone oxidoreductase subunit L
MAEESLINLVENDTLITLAALVIIIPFLTGIALLIMRAIEIKKSIDTDTKFKFDENLTGNIGVAGLGGSVIMALIVTIQYFSQLNLTKENISHPVINWVVGDYNFLPSGTGPFKWGIALSPLSVIMMLLLSIIAFTIHLYATEYMHGDSAFTRFFGTLNFFTGSMFGFVLSSNLFMAFVFWELLGFASYLLIGYYWPKASASSAAKKAFLYNKVGDVSFMIGIALIWSRTVNLTNSGLITAPTLDYYWLKHYAQIGIEGFDMAFLWLPSLLIFGGAVGKSAQLPLFGWLPEAMEGPTPVSALLHSSTMVKAGLFLGARIYSLFFTIDLTDLSIVENSFIWFTPNFIAWIGTLTALAGGLMALTADDLKKVLAFSTISQLGFIGLALGAGGLTASFFHLISHATFKSLLFLCAGAIIHSIHKPHANLSELGGLKKHMPHTYWTMLIGLLGLAGVPLMSGFWSKDAVLLAMEESDIFGHQFLLILAIITAGITAFYSAKLFILTFLGEARYDKETVHPSPAGLKTRISLWIIASLVIIESLWWTFSIGLGQFNILGKNFEYYLGSLLGQHQSEFNIVFAIPSILAVLIGIGLAVAIYHYNILEVLQNHPVMHKIFAIAERRFYVDEGIYWFASNPVMNVGDKFSVVDKKFIDGIVIDKVITQGTLTVADTSDKFDIKIIDKFVNLLGDWISFIGKRLRKLQTGMTPNYALMMVIGLGLILTYLTISTLF